MLNKISGVTFDQAAAEGETFKIEDRTIRVIGLQALLTNKRAAGREQDLADVAALIRKPIQDKT